MSIIMSLQRLCLLTVFITVSGAQHSVTQGPSVTAAVGQNVRLPCTLGGGLTVSSNRVIFVQQKADKFTSILYYFTDSNTKRGDGVPTRFVGSGSGNVGYLNINGVQAEDEAVYHCATWTGSQWMFGGGTQLIIPTGEVKAPVVFIFGPSEEELKTEKCSTVCTATDFNPGAASIQWTVDGKPWTSEISTTPIRKQSNSLYMGSSVLTMPTSDYQGYNEIICKVTHQGKEIVQTLKRSDCN